MKRIAGAVVFCLIAGLVWGFQALAGPCGIISQKQAEAILGEAVKPGREKKLAGIAAGASCRYFTAAPLAKRGRTGSVSLLMYDAATMEKGGGAFTSPRKYFDRTKETYAKRKNAGLKEIPGLGGGAFWLASGESLHFMHKNVYYVLSIKDMKEFSSKKGRDDLNAKVAAHRLKLCEDAARKICPEIAPGPQAPGRYSAVF